MSNDKKEQPRLHRAALYVCGKEVAFTHLANLEEAHKWLVAPIIVHFWSRSCPGCKHAELRYEL